jgi:sulfur relay protein TusB/DsrH
MIVLIKSAPQTDEAQRGLKLAKDTSSDVVLLQDGVFHTKQDSLKGLEGTAYVIEDDARLRGTGANTEGLKTIDYAGFMDLITRGDKVIGLI